MFFIFLKLESLQYVMVFQYQDFNLNMTPKVRRTCPLPIKTENNKIYIIVLFVEKKKKKKKIKNKYNFCSSSRVVTK